MHVMYTIDCCKLHIYNIYNAVVMYTLLFKVHYGVSIFIMHVMYTLSVITEHYMYLIIFNNVHPQRIQIDV